MDRKEYFKKYRQEHKKHNKEWRENNIQHLSEYHKKWQVENREYINKYHREWFREWYKKRKNNDILNDFELGEDMVGK